jgi:hypothetical protein
MSQLFILQTCKKSCLNTLYSTLHKIDKHVDLSTYIFKSTKFIIFCVAYDTKNFILKFYKLVGYTINYAQIYFYIF